MILIHTLNTFYKISSTKNIWLSMADFVVFGFIMLIGISVSFHYLKKFKHSRAKEIWRYFLTRALKIMLVYYSYAFLMQIVLGHKISLDIAFRILFLLNVNYNMLILIPITFYIAIIPLAILIHRRYKPFHFSYALAGLGIYMISYIIDYIAFDSSFRFLKNIIFGHMDWLSFPLLQWIFPFLFGISIGFLFRENIKENSNTILSGGIGAFIIYIITTIILISTGVTVNQTTHKFPPTLYHYIYSLSACLIILAVLMKTENLKSRFLDWLSFLGKNSLFAFVTQWVIIEILVQSVGQYIHPLILTVTTFILTYQLCKINMRFRLL